jgi:hypothetical protein
MLCLLTSADLGPPPSRLNYGRIVVRYAAGGVGCVNGGNASLNWVSSCHFRGDTVMPRSAWKHCGSSPASISAGSKRQARAGLSASAT